MRANEFIREAGLEAPLQIPTPAQDTVEKAGKAMNQIDSELEKLDVKKIDIEREIADIKNKIKALKYGPPEGSRVKQKGDNWVGRDKDGRPIAGGPIGPPINPDLLR